MIVTENRFEYPLCILENHYTSMPIHTNLFSVVFNFSYDFSIDVKIPGVGLGKIEQKAIRQTIYALSWMRDEEERPISLK